MDEQYPKFVVDSQHARRRLAQMFETGVDGETKCRFSLRSDRTFTTAPQKNSGKGERSIGDLVRSVTSFVNRAQSRIVNQPASAKPDTTGLGHLLVPVLLSELGPAQTHNALYWLLVSPHLWQSL